MENLVQRLYGDSVYAGSRTDVLEWRVGLSDLHAAIYTASDMFEWRKQLSDVHVLATTANCVCEWRE